MSRSTSRTVVRFHVSQSTQVKERPAVTSDSPECSPHAKADYFFTL